MASAADPKLWVKLKGQCQKIFCLSFFQWIIFPQASENNIRCISNFSKLCRDTFTSEGAPLVSMPPVENLPPMSTTPAAAGVNYTSGKFATGINDAGGKFCHWYRWCCWYLLQVQYQTADTLKWTWRKKFIYMLILLHKGVPNKELKLFWFKTFFICHRCQRRHRGCTLSCEYLRECSKKFEPALRVYSRAWGKLILKKTWS